MARVPARLPYAFTQNDRDLLNLPKSSEDRTENVLSQINGCWHRLWNTGKTAEQMCRDGGFNYPNNGEYVYSKEGVKCSACGIIAGRGIWGYNDKEGPGRLESCLVSNGHGIGKRCAVRRIEYHGEIGSCLLKAARYSKDPLKPTTTNNGTRNNAPGAEPSWGNIGGNSYTCDPSKNKGSGVDQHADSVVRWCTPNDKKDFTDNVVLAWQSDQYKDIENDPTGYCYNFVNNYATPIASSIVSRQAARGMSITPSFKDFGISEAEKGNFKYAKATTNILDVCNKFGGCDTSLTDMCKGFKRADIYESYKKYLELKAQGKIDLANAYLNKTKACGCHLPTAEYLEWQRLGVDQANAACDPLCMIAGVSQRWTNNAPAKCTQNLCVIDNVSIDIINSNVGDINFNVICGCGANASPGSCRCVFGDIRIFAQNSSVLKGLNFNQNCGGNCQKPDPNNPGNFIRIDCDTGIPTGNQNVPGTFDKVIKWFQDNKTLIIICVVALIILGLTMWVLYRKNCTSDNGRSKSIANKVTLSDVFGDMD